MNRQWIFSLAIACCSGIHANEGLELRRIADYWKEQDFSSVKRHIDAFLESNSQSTYCDTLYGMLGDIYFKEKDYANACAAYERVREEPLRQKCSVYRLQCLYNLGDYAAVVTQVPDALKSAELKSGDVDTLRFCLAESRFYLGKKENREDLLSQALVDYQQLMQTSYSDRTLLPQALILSSLKEYKKAASAYLLLAEKEREKREDYLFYAGSLQVQEDKRAAIETFDKICALDGKTAPKAAFNQLSLLFQEKDYKGFILAYDRLAPLVSEDKGALVEYYLGKSLLHTEDYLRASACFSRMLGGSLSREQEKNTLLSLITCADKLDDSVLLEKTVRQLVKGFESSLETSQALLLQMHRARDRREWVKAREAVDLLIRVSSDSSKKEDLVYDQGLLFEQERRWDEAGNLFEKLAKESLNEALNAKALRHWVHSRLEEVKAASFVSERVKKERLQEALQAALTQSSSFSTREKKQLRFLSGKTTYALERYEETIGILTEYCRDFAKDPSCAEAHLILAESYRKGPNDGLHFVLNAEMALSLNVSLQEPHLLHLALYNTYLELAAKSSDEEKAEKVNRAADHLYLSLEQVKSVQNKRWLADYYLQEVKKGRKECRIQAASVLKHLVGPAPLEIDAHSMEKEGEAIRLAQLYKELGLTEERIELLEALKARQDAVPDLLWRYQRMTTFELAAAYGEKGEADKALPLLDTLITDTIHSYYSNAAKWQKAKLRFAALQEEEKREDSRTVLHICDQLKEVELQRRLHSEPLHLESALLYVDIKTSLVSLSEQKAKKRILLSQLKERFLEKGDCLVQEYFSTKSQFPDKMHLFDQYIRFIDLEIERLTVFDPIDLQDRLDVLWEETQEDLLKKRILKSKNALETEKV